MTKPPSTVSFPNPSHRSRSSPTSLAARRLPSQPESSPAALVTPMTPLTAQSMSGLAGRAGRRWSGRLEGLQCIFLLSDSGEVMLEKQLTGHQFDRSICELFRDQILTQGGSLKLVPIIASPNHYLFQVVREGITFCLAAKSRSTFDGN